MANDETINDLVKRLGADYRQSMIEEAAKVLGNVPSSGQKLNPQAELQAWMAPTSPAARRALELGGTLEDAHAANQLWAADLKARQAKALKLGAQKADLEQAGVTDEQIFEACRTGAYKLGQFYARSDPGREMAYHERMAERAARLRAGQAIDQGEAGGDGSGTNDG